MDTLAFDAIRLIRGYCFRGASMLNPRFKRSPAITGASGIPGASAATRRGACASPPSSPGSRIRSFVTALAWMFMLSTQAWSQTITPGSYGWASNLLPALRAPSADAACVASWTQWEVVSGWAVRYGYGGSGWNYSRYEGGATEGGCVALYWYPQVGPPKPGDTYIFASSVESVGDCSRFFNLDFHQTQS